jgi:hypothetical protein
MSEYSSQVSLILELAITFFGVFLAFSLDRAIDWRKEKHTKKDLLKNLSCKLNEMMNNLTGDIYRLYPDIWDSAVASGQIELLDSNQITKLANVYRFIKGTDYEAVRVRDAKEAFKQNENQNTTNPLFTNHLYNNWANLSKVHFQRMEETKEKIGAILKEKWWNN